MSGEDRKTDAAPSGVEPFALFLELYGSLPRAAPGSDDCTRRALDLLPAADRRAVLDIGCGPGAQALSLAEALPDARLVAFDILPPMAAEASRRCSEAGVLDRAFVAVADMAAPPVSAAAMDLIWCEGAIYNLGVAAALTSWKALLSDNGCIAFTEAVWLSDDPDDEVREWWTTEYPAITDVPGVTAAITAAGYRLIASFVLPPDTWWNGYYRPLQSRIPAFRERHAGDSAASEVADAAEREISMFRRFGDAYGYAFFIVRPDG